MNHCSHSSKVPTVNAASSGRITIDDRLRSPAFAKASARQASAIEQERDQSVLDEVHALDGVDLWYGVAVAHM